MSNAPVRPARKKPPSEDSAGASRWTFSFFSSGSKSVERTEESLEEDAFDVDQAREAAVQEVKGALSGPQEVSRLRKIRSEYEAQRGAVEVQIALLTGRQAEEARAGLELVGRSQERVEKVKVLKGRLEAALERSSALLPHYELLRRAHFARRNLHRTAQELESIMEMPAELKRIEEMIQGLGAVTAPRDDDDDEDDDDDSSEGYDSSARRKRDDSDSVLPEVHKRLMQLERRQRAALQSGRHEGAKRDVIEEQLGALNGLFRKVESRCLQIVRNCIAEAQNRPAMLVKALQMIQRQEAADARARKEHLSRGGAEQAAVRGWYAKSVEELEEYLRANFYMLCGTLVEGETVDIGLVVQEQQKVVDDLVTAKDLVEPCFAPQYEIFDLFVRTYHALIVQNVEALTEKFAPTLSTRDIIDLVGWLREYHAQLQDLEPRESSVQPVLTSPEKLTQLLQGYNLQTESMMRNWAARILEDDLNVPPESSVDGKLYTIAPIDLFKMIDQQFEVADSLEVERSMHTLAMSVSQVLEDYCASVHDVVTRLWNELQIDHIAAQVNNAARCVDCCSSLMEELQKKLPPELLDDVELGLVGDNFAKVGKDGCDSLAKVIVLDLVPLLKRLFTFKWCTGEDRLAESLSATILDYADEIQEYLIGTYYRRVMIEVLERVVVATAAQALEAKKHEGAVITIDADFVAGFDEDYEILMQCFLDASLPERMLLPRLAPLRLLRHLMAVEVRDAGGAKAVAGWFAESRKEFGDLEVEVVARVLRRREMDSKLRHTALAACADAARHSTHREGGGKPLFKLVYEELGVKPQPYSASEGVVSTLMQVVASRRGKKAAAGGGREGRGRERAGERRGRSRDRAGEAEEEEERPAGCYALDIAARLAA